MPTKNKARYFSEGKYAAPTKYRKGTEYWRNINADRRSKPTSRGCRSKRMEIIVIPEHTRCVPKYKGAKKKTGCRPCGAKNKKAKGTCKRMVCAPYRRCKTHRRG